MFAPPVVKPKSAPPQRSAIAAQRPGPTVLAQRQLLQRTIGNQALTRLLAQRAGAASNAPGPIQAKLKVGAAGDPLEHEADRVADQVMRMPAPEVSAAAPPALQRKSDGPQAAGSEAPASVHEVLRSPGQPLDAETRGFFEPRFGQDFSDVRVHTDPVAEQSAREVSANAYTAGHNMVFDAGRFAPGTHQGRQLIAHELTHVVQQTERGALSIQRQPDTLSDYPSEKVSMKEIVAFEGKTGEAMVILSDDTKALIEVTENELGAPDENGSRRTEYTLVRTSGHDYEGAGAFRWKNPYFRETKETKYRWADTVKVTIVPKYVRDFFSTDSGQTASPQDLLSVANAGRILVEHGVTKEELLLQHQRQVDLQELGIRQGEDADPELWALSYAGGREQARVAERANVATLVGAAKRLSLASPALYRQDPLLEIIDAPTKLSAMSTTAALNLRETRPMQGPSEKIEAPFSDISDLRQTMRAFEKALLSDLRSIAASFLDDTETKLIGMNRTFVGLGESRQGSPAALEQIIQGLNKDADVASVKQEHVEFTKTIEREWRYDYEHGNILAESIEGLLFREGHRQAALEQERVRYNEALRKVVAEKSILKLMPGTDVGELLFAQSPRKAQLKLIDFIVDGRAKVRDARNKLDDPTFLYSADIVIAKEKERLAEGLRPKRSSASDNTALGRLFSEGLESERRDTVYLIIDKIASERGSQTSTWQDIWKVFQFALNFVPGPLGWAARAGARVVEYGERSGNARDQRLLSAGGMSAAAVDPNAPTVGDFLFETLIDAPGVSAGAKSTKQLTLGLEDVGRSTRREAAELAGNLGEREVTDTLPKSVIADPVPINEPFIIEPHPEVGPVQTSTPPGFETSQYEPAVGPVKTRKPAGYETAQHGAPVKRRMKTGTVQDLDNPRPPPRPGTSRPNLRKVTKEEQQYGIPDNWKAIRGATPPKKGLIIPATKYPVIEGMPDPALPGLIVSGTAHPDHIVSVGRIRKMEGFAFLDEAEQLEVLNIPENFVPLSPAANQSKGPKSFMDWLVHAETGTMVNPQFRADMIIIEQRLELSIPEMINRLVREKMSRIQWK